MADAISGEKGRNSIIAAVGNPDVRKLIIEQAEKHVESLSARMDALDTRLSALGGLLFAAAALATNVSVGGDKAFAPAIWVAAVAALIFAGASLFTLYGLISRQSAFKGEPASWWLRGDASILSSLDEYQAQVWLGEKLEATSEILQVSVERRAKAFNRASVCGAIGAAAIFLTAALAALGPRPVSNTCPDKMICFDNHLPASSVPRLRPVGTWWR